MSIYRYKQYREILKVTPFNGRVMPFSWGNLPNNLSFKWMAYAEMFAEFSCEIANSINSLSNYTHQLTAWRDVVESLDSNQKKLDVAVEFINPLATIALNFPYVIRSRFIFAVAHLCHQANRAKHGAAWKDDLSMDGEIYFKDADASGKGWKKYNKLKLQLERIGAKSYQAATYDFRNTYNHRFSPSVVIGMTQFVTRYVDKATGKVGYGFGGKKPLTLDVVVNCLEQECSYCYAAFEALQNLVREHEEAIVSSISIDY